MTWRTRALATVLAMVLAGGGAAAQALDEGIGDWDRDDSGFVDPEEFELGFNDSGLFDRWDSNADSLLDQDEWGALGTDGELGAWDRDADQLLDETETRTGLWDAWDADASGVIEDNEWADPDLAAPLGE